MVRADYATITEAPGRTVGVDQFHVICTRYAFAARFARGRVFEAGCGCGFGLGVLARRARAVVGGELMHANIVQARATYAGRPDVRLVQCDAHHLPFPDGAFDTVLAMAVIYYLDLGRFLDECRRILGPEGTVAFCTPNCEAPGFRPGRLTTAYYARAELVRTFGQRGFGLDLYGAFPVPTRRVQAASRLIALGGTLLAAVPLSGAGRDTARKAFSRFIGFQRRYLPLELSDDDITGAAVAPFVALTGFDDAGSFRMLYGVARLASP